MSTQVSNLRPEHRSEWLKPRKVRVEGKLQYSFKSSCCGIIVQWNFSEKPTECPYCFDKYWDKPNYEYQLFTLQEEYQKTRDQAVSVKIFEILEAYSRICIVNTLHKTKAFLRSNDFNEKSRELAYLVYEFILKEKWIQFSFGSLIGKILPGVLYKNYERESEISMTPEFNNPKVSTERDVDFMALKNKNLQFTEDHVGNPALDIHTSMSKVLMKEFFPPIVKKIFYDYSNREVMLFLIGVRYKLKKHRPIHMNRFYNAFGTQIESLVDRSELMLKRYLRDSQGDAS